MATEAEKIEYGGPIDQYVHYSGKVRLAKEINFEAWSRTLIGFIRHKGLEQELKDWSGGWPCPIGSDADAPLVYVAAPDLLEALKDITEAYIDAVRSNAASRRDPEFDTEATVARAAISKAEGRS